MEEVSGGAIGRVSSRPPSRLSRRVSSRPASDPSGRDSPGPPKRSSGPNSPHSLSQQREPSRQAFRRRPPHTPICRGCEKPFKFEASPIKGAPAKDRRLPFLLDCGHTRCEDCAKADFRPGKGVVCLKCAYVTPLHVNPGDNLHICIEQLPLDFYAFGILSDEVLAPRRYSTFSIREEIEKSLKDPLRCEPDDRDEVARKFGVPLPDNLHGAGDTDSSTNASAPVVEEAEPEQKCEECEENRATIKCSSCQCNFCKSCCERIHSVSRLFLKHEMEDLDLAPRPLILSNGSSTEPPRTVIPKMCQVHRKRIDHFCKQDQRFICSTCAEDHHAGHALTNLSEAVSQMQDTLAPAVERCRRSTNMLASTGKELDERVIKDIQAGADATAAFVYKHFADLHACLQKRQSEIIKQIVSMSLDEIVPILHLKNLLKEKGCEIQDIMHECHQLMKNPICDPRPMANKIDLALDFPVVLDHLPTTDHGIQFCAPKEDFLEKMMYKYGNLVNPNSASQDGACFQLIKAEDAPGDVMMNILENSGTATESEEANSSLTSQRRTRFSSAKSEASSHASSRYGSNSSLHHQPKDRSQLLQGETCDVRISFIDNPLRFYVHRAEEVNEAYKLVRRLTDWCQEPRNVRPMTANNINVGYLYAAKWSGDQQFYRARVLRFFPDFKVTPKDDSDGAKVECVEAEFIDYGNVELIPLTWFCELPPKFKSFPGKSHHCALYGISPPKRAASFSQEVVDSFLKMVGDRDLQMSVRGKVDGVWQVDLHQAQLPTVNLESPLSVRDALVFLDFAVFTSNLSAPESVVPIHDRRTYLPPDVPRLNLTVETFVIPDIQSPKEFYVHFNPSRDVGYLQDMMMKLQRIYNQDDKDFLTLFCPQPGMICVAKYSGDRLWYRAKVMEIIGKRMVEVEFVDYGNREQTSIWNVKKLTNEFLVLPAQAVKCALSCAIVCDYDEAALKRGKQAFDQINSASLMPDPKRQTFEGRVIQAPSKSGDPHVIQLQSDLVKAVDEAVKSAMQGSDDLEHFVVRPPDPSELPVRDRESPPPRSDESKPSRSRRSKKEKTGGDPNLPTGVKTASKEQKQSITVSHSLRPDHFYIQITRAKEDLNILEKKLTTECESSSAIPLDDVDVGNSCAALVKFQEYEGFQKWCRITVLEKLSKSKIRARLIDTGKEKVLHISDLRKFQSSDLLKTAAFALDCHLLNIVHAGGSETWSQVACEYFTDLVKRNETSYTDLISTSEDRYGIELFVKTVEEETALEPAKIAYEDVPGLLIDRGFAFRPRKKPRSARNVAPTDAANPESVPSINGVASTPAPASAPAPAPKTAPAPALPSLKIPFSDLVSTSPALSASGNGYCVSNDSTVVTSSVTILERNLDNSFPTVASGAARLPASGSARLPTSLGNSALLKPDFFDRSCSTPPRAVVASSSALLSAVSSSTVPVITSVVTPTISSHDGSMEMPSLEVPSSYEDSIAASPRDCQLESGSSHSHSADTMIVGVEAAEVAAAAASSETDSVETPRDRSHEFPRWKHFNVDSIRKMGPNDATTFCFTSFVTFVDNRGVIWATPSNIYDENTIHEMTGRTQKLYKDQDPIDLAGELQTGQAVMAQYLKDDDDKWYRARVDKVVQVGGVSKVDVVFVEFGNTERVFPHQIRTVLLADLLAFPQCNVEMNLCHIRPVNGAKRYTNSDVTMIHDLLVGHSVLSRVVPNLDGTLNVDSEGLLSIDFCQPMTDTSGIDDHGVILGDMEAGRVLLAVKRAELVPERQTPLSTTPPPPVAHSSTIHQASRSSSETSNLGYNIGPEDCDGDEVGDDDRVLEESLRALKLKPTEDTVPAGYATDVLKHRFMRMTVPEVDFPYVVLAWNDDGFHYHYDIEHPRFSEEPVLMDKKSECEESIKFEQDMQIEADQWPSMNLPQVDIPAAARWHSDGKWYRAQILSVLYHPYQVAKVTAHFVDWGNADQVKATDLRYIPLEGLRPRRRSTRGMIWKMKNMSPIILHPQREKLSHLLSTSSFHGVMKNIERLSSGDLQVELTMSLEGSDEFALKDYVRLDGQEPKSEDFA